MNVVLTFKVRKEHNKTLCGKHAVENLFILDNPQYSIRIDTMNIIIINKLNSHENVENKHGIVDKGMLSPHTVNKLICSTTNFQIQAIT